MKLSPTRLQPFPSNFTSQPYHYESLWFVMIHLIHYDSLWFIVIHCDSCFMLHFASSPNRSGLHKCDHPKRRWTIRSVYTRLPPQKEIVRIATTHVLWISLNNIFPLWVNHSFLHSHRAFSLLRTQSPTLTK
jgi:hypothetical protein